MVIILGLIAAVLLLVIGYKCQRSTIIVIGWLLLIITLISYATILYSNSSEAAVVTKGFVSTGSNSLSRTTISGNNTYLLDIKPHDVEVVNGKYVDSSQTDEKFAFSTQAGDIQTVTPNAIFHNADGSKDDFDSIVNGPDFDPKSPSVYFVVNIVCNDDATPMLTVQNRTECQKVLGTHNKTLAFLFGLNEKDSLGKNNIYEAVYTFTLPSKDIAYFVS